MADHNKLSVTELLEMDNKSLVSIIVSSRLRPVALAAVVGWVFLDMFGLPPSVVVAVLGRIRLHILPLPATVALVACAFVIAQHIASGRFAVGQVFVLPIKLAAAIIIAVVVAPFALIIMVVLAEQMPQQAAGGGT